MLEDMKQKVGTTAGMASDVKEMKKKIEENLRLNEDAKDALARAEQAERDLEEQVQHNARLQQSLESARLEVARSQEALVASEAKAARQESVSAELEKELGELREQVAAARRRLQALGDDLAKSNDRVDKAKARVREMEKEMENKQKAISASYARLKELRAWSSSRKAEANHEMKEFKRVAEARFQEQVEENGLLRSKVEELTIEIQVLRSELEESRQEVTVLTRLLQLGDPSERRPAHPGSAERHGKEEEGLAARPDQGKTLSVAAAAAGGAAAAATAQRQDDTHKQTPAPYHTIPLEIDHNSPNVPTEGQGHPQSCIQEGRTVIVKQGESIQAALDSASPGITIIIEAGIYTESLRTKMDGEKEKPITLKGPSGGLAAILQLPDPSSCFEINHDFYTLDNFTIDGMAQPKRRCSCLIIKGKRNHRSLTKHNGERYLSSVDGVIVKNMKIYNFNIGGIYLSYFATNCMLFHNCITSRSASASGVRIGERNKIWERSVTKEPDVCCLNRVYENYIDVPGNGISIREGAMENVVETNYCTGQSIENKNGIYCRASSTVIRYNKVYCNTLKDNKLGGIRVNVEGNQICQNTITGKGDEYKAIRGKAANSHAENTECPFDAQLASLHQQRVKSSAGAPDRPVMWTSIDRWLKTAAGLDVEKKFPLGRVAGEVAWLKRNLPDPAATDGASTVTTDQKLAAEIADGVVFAHNDLLSGNVLVGPRGAKTISTLRLIDFEYSDYNPCGYDIANHFCECAGFDADFRRKYPSEGERRRFLRAYVEAARPEALRVASSADNLVGELARRVDRYALASHLTWALWAVIQANTSEIEGFDFADYALKRLDGYAFHKAKFYG
eukprot:g11499.t2